MVKFLDIIAIILTCNSIFLSLNFKLSDNELMNVLINHGFISIYYLYRR